jgi:class 3 adenylate cyclase
MTTTSTGRARVRVVMFVDISGSTRLYKELGDVDAVKRVRGCLNLLCGVVEEHAGRTLKNTGDGLMCDFAHADQALAAAEAMQLAVQGQTEPSLSIHVGCHLGHVIENSGDLFGDTVNIAARVTGVAAAGQIIATLETVQTLSQELQAKVRALDSVSVKGHTEPLPVFDYLWGRRGDLTIVGVPVPKFNGSRLRLACGGREILLDRSSKPNTIVLGRHSTCEMTVHDPATSRQHATIEVRGDKFVLVDHSANGTYVTWEGAAETCLKREEMILPVRGRLGLGSSTSAQGVTIVVFSRETKT